LRPLTHYR